MRFTLPLACMVMVVAFAGCAGTADNVTSLNVEFGGQAEDFESSVPFDADSRPTAQKYADEGIPHADGYTAHDQLEDWSRGSGRPYSATSFNSSFGAGFFLTAIAGVEADGVTAYWSLSVNGETSEKGMSDVILRDGDAVTWTYTVVSAPPSNDPDPIGVTVDPPAPTQGETVTITGSVNQDATVSIDGGPAIEAKAGRWTLTSPPLAYGQTPTKVRVEDGTHSVVVDVTLVRLASGTFEAKFTAHPVHPDFSDVVWYDPGTLTSLPAYDGKAAPRAPTFTVHDFMAEWSAKTARAIEYSYGDSFGFGVDKIDGVGQPLTASAPPYWCYKVNGESADVGISLQEMHPGDVVTWEYAGCM